MNKKTTWQEIALCKAVVSDVVATNSELPGMKKREEEEEIKGENGRNRGNDDEEETYDEDKSEEEGMENARVVERIHRNREVDDKEEPG